MNNDKKVKVFEVKGNIKSHMYLVTEGNKKGVLFHKSDIYGLGCFGGAEIIGSVELDRFKNSTLDRESFTDLLLAELNER